MAVSSFPFADLVIQKKKQTLLLRPWKTVVGRTQVWNLMVLVK